MNAIAHHNTALTDRGQAVPGIEGEGLGRAPLASFTAADGRRRELVARRAARGSVLVIDQDAASLADRRLVAHLGADEATANATLVAALYVADDHGRHCRALVDADWFAAIGQAGTGGSDEPPSELVDRDGRRYRIEPVTTENDGTQLRWTRRAPVGVRRRARAVSLRVVVGALQAYEPARTMTRWAIDDAPPGHAQVLRRELYVLDRSPYVLNRGLREAVLRAVADGESWSAIAMRSIAPRKRAACMVGDTSWLARRIGLKGENTHKPPTPWVHADVLARIARDGLGLDPRDVELA